eukprot:scaffold17307_cov119-Isochrysis_galbana.AAC.7
MLERHLAHHLLKHAGCLQVSAKGRERGQQPRRLEKQWRHPPTGVRSWVGMVGVKEIIHPESFGGIVYK